MPAPRTVQDARDLEVLRANRELAAYFRGQRTEREAKAALKIIKAFIRERQHTPVEKRRPLPASKGTAAPPRPATKRKAAVRRRTHRTPTGPVLTEVAAASSSE